MYEVLHVLMYIGCSISVLCTIEMVTFKSCNYLLVN